MEGIAQDKTYILQGRVQYNNGDVVKVKIIELTQYTVFYENVDNSAKTRISLSKFNIVWDVLEEVTSKK